MDSVKHGARTTFLFLITNSKESMQFKIRFEEMGLSLAPGPLEIFLNLSELPFPHLCSRAEKGAFPKVITRTN